MSVPAVLLSAQEPRTLTYTPETVPPALTLRRGDVLQFEGPGLRDRQPRVFVLRAGDQVRANGTTRGHWSVRYDTRTESLPASVVTLWEQVRNEWTLRAQLKVRIVEEAPLNIQTPAPAARLSEPVTLKVEATGDEKADRIGYTLDGKPLGLFSDHQADVVWNPMTMPAGRHLLGAVARLTDGSLYTLDAIPITIAAKVRALPFAVGETLDITWLNGKIQARADLDPVLKPRQVTYYIDGQVIGQRRKAPFDQIWWNPRPAATGAHALTVDVEEEEGKHLVSVPLPFSVYRRPGKRAVTEEPFVPGPTHTPSDTNLEGLASVESALLDRKSVSVSAARLPEHLTVASGTDIVLTGSFQEANDTEIAAYVDEQRLAGFNGKGKYRLAIATTHLPAGSHVLKVRLNFAGGQTRPVGQTRLLVFDGTPVHLHLSEGEAGIWEPVMLRPAFAPGFVPQSVLFFVDGHALTPDPANPQRALWDPRSSQPGTHALRAVATDADGVGFRSEPQLVTIPVRVRAEPPESVVVTAAVHTLPLKAKLVPGLTPVQVSYQIDGATVAIQNHPPFDSAVCDVTMLPPGEHTLTIAARDENDALYISAGARFEVRNAAWAARRAQADAQLQRRLREIAVRNPKKAPAPLRGPIAGAYATKPALREGMVGHAQGLAVLTLGSVPVIGRLFPIEASVRPGTGGFHFEAEAARDTHGAAERAFAFARQKAIQAGQGLDWERTEVVLRHPDARAKTQGLSSGVADAVTLVSACLQMPVDRSVAISGTLGPNGQIESVGGILQKMEAVFHDPATRTLILPAGSIAEADLVTMYLQRPENLTHRRIILAHNMEEVLRQALIGYNDAYEFADELVQEGIGFYLNKDNARALEALKQARDLTPENATISVWINLMQSAGKK